MGFYARKQCHDIVATKSGIEAPQSPWPHATRPCDTQTCMCLMHPSPPSGACHWQSCKVFQALCPKTMSRHCCDKIGHRGVVVCGGGPVSGVSNLAIQHAKLGQSCKVFQALCPKTISRHCCDKIGHRGAAVCGGGPVSGVRNLAMQHAKLHVSCTPRRRHRHHVRGIAKL